MVVILSGAKDLFSARGAQETASPAHQEHLMSTTAAPTEALHDSAGVSLEQVRHVADLANLELTAEELPRLARDLNAVLGYIAQLNELDTTTVPPMAQIGDLLSEALGIAPATSGETLRPDEIKPSLDRAVVMAEAPETDGRFFKVPKVIER
jgi:aspartyl-tRNA(Asn)/glutamyl-tRNA(Gln) amidotransferase subunit C